MKIKVYDKQGREIQEHDITFAIIHRDNGMEVQIEDIDGLLYVKVCQSNDWKVKHCIKIEDDASVKII